VTVRFIERELFIDENRYELPYPIDDAIEYDKLVVVLYSPDSAPKTYGQFHNLVAFDRSGRPRWVAELPTSSTGDRYYKVPSMEPMVAYSTQSYDCTISQQTGRILSKTFTK
jgi:hypothetical protein